MNRSIIAAAIIISVAILLNGYLDRVARTPHAGQAAEKQLPMVREKSVAVLPFQDLSSSDQNPGFATGIQQEIINRLTKVRDLKVVSRDDTLQYDATRTRNLRYIGQQLKAANLVEGSVQHVGNKVRVNVQLIDAQHDTHLWAETFDRELTDVFAIESEIATSVATQLGAKLSVAEQAAIERSGSHP